MVRPGGFRVGLDVDRSEYLLPRDSHHLKRGQD